MTGRRLLAGVGAAAVGLSGCGGAAKHTRSTTSVRGPQPAAGLTEVIGVPAVGRFVGRCVAGQERFTLRFIAEPGTATDAVYELGSGGGHRPVQLDPGHSLTWRLRARAVTTREPADPLAHTPGASVRTTAPLHVVIEQGSEPHSFRVEVRLALAAAIGDTAACAPVNTQIGALTYFNGGGP